MIALSDLGEWFNNNKKQTDNQGRHDGGSDREVSRGQDMNDDISFIDIAHAYLSLFFWASSCNDTLYSKKG